MTDLTVPLWTNLLAEYDVADVRAAFSDYVKKGRFAPVPADILERCDGIKRARNGEMTPDVLWEKTFHVVSHGNVASEALIRNLRANQIPEWQINQCVRAARSVGCARMVHIDPSSPEFSFARRDFLQALERESKVEATQNLAVAATLPSAIKSMIGNVKVLN